MDFFYACLDRQRRVIVQNSLESTCSFNIMQVLVQFTCILLVWLDNAYSHPRSKNGNCGFDVLNEEQYLRGKTFYDIKPLRINKGIKRPQTGNMLQRHTLHAVIPAST